MDEWKEYKTEDGIIFIDLEYALWHSKVHKFKFITDINTNKRIKVE